jgi:hypothetical protein
MGYTNGDPLKLIFNRPSSDAVIPSLRATLQKHPDTVLLVFDMMGKVAQIDDYNDYAEVTNKLEPITNLARETGVAMLLLHHGKKESTGDVINDALGSTALTGNVDIIVGMTQDKALKYTNYMVTSSRVGPSVSSMTLAWDPETHLYTVGEELGLPEKGEKLREDRIVEFLQQQPTRSATVSDVYTGVKGSQFQLRAAIETLVGAKVIVRSGKGRGNSPFVLALDESALKEVQTP